VLFNSMKTIVQMFVSGEKADLLARFVKVRAVWRNNAPQP